MPYQQVGQGYYWVNEGEDPLQAALRNLQASSANVGGADQGIGDVAATQQNALAQALTSSRRPRVTASNLSEEERGPTADTRFYVKGPGGRIDTGLSDGRDPRQFASYEEMRQWMEANGEALVADQEFDTPEQAIKAVRDYTGNPDYNGYQEGYQPPTPKPGSPAARMVPYAEWNSTQNNGRGTNNKGGVNADGRVNGDGTTYRPSLPPGATGADGRGPTDYGALGYYGNRNAAAPGLPSDSEDRLAELLQRNLDQGARGQEAYTGITSDLKEYLAFAKSGAEQNFGRQNYLTNLLLGLGADGQIGPGGYTPGSLGSGLSSAIGTMNEATGLSPEAMAALRMQAIEGPENAYQGQVSQLKTQLQGRGAYGGGDTPGSLGDIVGGYAPLMMNRDAQRGNMLSQTILADEQRKFDTLGLNRQTAANAMSTYAGLNTGLVNAFNPNAWLGTGESSLGNLLGATNARNQQGFQGLQGANDLAGTMYANQPGSFADLLKSSLLSTGIKTGGDLLGDWLKNRNKPADPNDTNTPSNPDNDSGFWGTLGNVFKGIFGF